MPNWYSREHWYRIPEREKELIPASLSVGDEIVPKRVIVRCGYYHNYTDAPIREMNEITVKLLSKRTGYDDAECQRIILAMDNRQGPFSWTTKYQALTRLYYEARRVWVHQQPTYNGTPADYRTFWYVDLPEKEQWWHKAAWWDSPLREILGKNLRMIGQPDVDYDYGEFGAQYCVGTYFAEHGRQTLYRVAPYGNHLVSADTDSKWYVHPLDAERIDNAKSRR